MEEGKAPTINSIRVTNQSRCFPMRLLGFMLLFIGICIGFSIINMFKIRYLGTQNIISGAQTLIQSCFQESNSLQNWIEPPSTYMHTLDDSELFWRASFVPQIKDYPFKRSPKIAFMFLTRGPLPLAPLWERFFKGNEEFYTIYVHTMPSYRANFSTSSVFYQKQVPSQVSHHYLPSFLIICGFPTFCWENGLKDSPQPTPIKYTLSIRFFLYSLV